VFWKATRRVEQALNGSGYNPLMRFYVYILSSQSRVLYTGVTRDLLRRVYQHRHGLVPGFTSRYHIDRLVYFEETPSARSAFEREHQIKGWSRRKKLELVESVNAGWFDLAVDWFPKSE
jgi:putative endonuclease